MYLNVIPDQIFLVVMKFNMILCRLGETALKSDYTRRFFENRLVSSMTSGLKSEKIDFSIKKEPGRIFVKTREIEKSCRVLEKIFGLTSVSPVREVVIKANMEKLIDSAEKFSKDFIKKGDTFAVRARRTGNDAFTSQMIERKVGGRLLKNGAKVNLTSPEKTLYIEVRNNKAYYFREKIKCPGGLPLGTQGSVLVLFSGGIDSAVAAWMAMKRGCKPVLLYMDSSPFSNQKVGSKRVKEVFKKLREWSAGYEMKLYRIKTGKIMEEITGNTRENLTCLLCKRMMYRLAEKVCKENKAKAIVTGENLGQVASQTLDNLNVLDQAVEIPVLRPLIGMDKDEIMNMAREIGTYEASIIPSGGCTAVPESPRTKGRIGEVLKEEKNINIEKLVKTSLKTLKNF